MPWPIGYSVGLSHLASLVTYWAAFLCLLARLVLPGRFTKASVGAVRRGEAAFQDVSSAGDDGKGNSSE